MMVHRSPSFSRDSEGVTATLGAILVAGILVAVFIVVQSEYVPVWEKNAEAEHMGSVAEHFEGLYSMLDSPADGLDGTGGTRGVPLRPDRPVMSGPTVSSHDLEYRVTGGAVEADVANFLAVRRGSDGRSAYGEDWNDLPSTESDVVEVYNLRLRIDEIGGMDQDDDSILVVVHDADGAFVGSFEFLQEKRPPDRYFVVTVQDADGNVLHGNAEPYFGAHSMGPYWIDMLEPNYRFDRILQGAEPPLSIELQEHGLTGDYAITYQSTSGMSGPGPLERPTAQVPLHIDNDCGAITYRGLNTRYLSQEYVLEHGALILQQSDGATFRIAPHFAAHHNAEWTTLDVRVPCLQGSSASIGSSTQATVSVSRLDDGAAWGVAKQIYLNVTTDYPDLWADLWRERLETAGLQDGVNHTVVVDAATGVVRLHVWGGSADELDLHLNLAFPTYQSEIRG